MARIKIEDLPLLEELSQEEMADIFGGFSDNPQELPDEQLEGPNQTGYGSGR